ncbi:MAG: arylsulfatase [Bryobacteraceae bacterium]|nr:arylsulfatase [Bryobacteraceae bacterium]
MNRRQFLTASAAAAALAPSLVQARATKPNILFLFADDLGFGDIGCYGGKIIPTPNVDSLARDGMKFTQAYCGSTVCAPSRSCLMTGQHTGHTRIRGNSRVDLLPEDVTVAEVLKGAGYRTGIFGKWGLGTAGNNGVPNRQGFDEWFGFLDQRHAHTQYPTALWENEEEVFLDGNFGPGRKDYAHDIFTKKGLDFIDKHKAGPWFCYMAWTIPHANNELTRQTGDGMEIPSLGSWASKPWPRPNQAFAATVEHLDQSVGQFLAKLKALNIENDTLVIFCSDNGPHKEGGNDPEFFDSNGPLRGIKRDLYDGGIRTVFLTRWNGQIAAGKTSDQIIAFWDVLPTAAELAGVKPPTGIDGISFVPALNRKPMAKREYLYWEFHEAGFSQAVRLDKWKGVRRKNRSAPIELYDVTQDQGEQSNVAAKHPDVVKRIAEIMQTARTDSTLFPVKEVATPATR